jgi:Family of unknown function (DUF5681)
MTTQWKKGTSGNPAGRTPGSGEVGKLRAAIAEHVPSVIAKLVEQAQACDVGAARLLLERCIATLKSIDQAAPVALPAATLTDQARAVLHAAASGNLTPAEAAQYLQGIGAVARVAETDELAARVTALETNPRKEEA